MLNIYNLNFIPSKNNIQINTSFFYIWNREIMTMNYKAGGVWFTVSVAPEFCIRMHVEGLVERTELMPRSEAGDVSLRVSPTHSED